MAQLPALFLDLEACFFPRAWRQQQHRRRAHQATNQQPNQQV
jgi:hypothetical protein